MQPSVLSVLALFLAILLSCTTAINVGLLAIALAWLIGVYAAGLPLAQVLANFPSQLFLTLVGVTLLFSQAAANGTLGKIAHRAVGLCRGQVGTIPIMFFVLAFGLAAIGPGSIASVALLAPMAMAIAGRTRIPALLMAIMVANGSSAASLSPIGPTGIVVDSIMVKMGLPGMQLQNFLIVALAHTLVGFAGYLIFGGWRLLNKGQMVDSQSVGHANTPQIVGPAATHDAGDTTEELGAEAEEAALPFGWRHWVTVGVIAVLLTLVVALEVNVGMAALVGSMVLVVSRTADESTAIRTMPWAPILMVCGVTVLVGVVEKTGGIDLFAGLMATGASSTTIMPVAAFVTGVISIYSSTAGVVLPAFLPTVPGILARIGGGDSVALVGSMLIGAHLVDVSPLSTTGALCLAAAAPGTDTRRLFRWMMVWGVSMTIVSAVGCYVIFGLWWPR